MSVRLLIAVRRPNGQVWYVGARTGDIAALADDVQVRIPVRDLELCNGRVGASLPIEWVKWIIDDNEETSDDDVGEDTGRAEHDTGSKRPVDPAGEGAVGRRRGDAACDERADRVDDARTHGTTAGTVRQPGPA